MHVINKHKAGKQEQKEAVYIGRGSPLGNPFVVGKHGDRDECVSQFRRYFIEKLLARDPVIESAFRALKIDDAVMCYCAPLACHGDVIKELHGYLCVEGEYEENLEQLRASASISPGHQLILKEKKKGFSGLDAEAVQLGISGLLNMELIEKGLTTQEFEKQYRKWLTAQLIERNPQVETGFRVFGSRAISSAGADITVIAAKAAGIYSEALLAVVEALEAKILTLAEKGGDYRNPSQSVFEYGLSLLLQDQYGQSAFRFKPEEDGVSHINVYSKGKTELGRLLTNFAHTAFEHPEYGHFSSVEAFWYWLATGKIENNIRHLHGIKAKQAGKLIRDTAAKSSVVLPEVLNFKAEVKKAILLKIEQNDRLQALLKESTLPLTHYYVWGEKPPYKVTYPSKYAWIHEYISDVRDYLNGKAHKLLVAGSRGITDYELIKKEIKASGYKVIEIVSGTARGADKLGERYAQEHELPIASFPADWDNLEYAGKKVNPAGFIRNSKMLDYATAAVIIHDGDSGGTSDMAKKIRDAHKPYQHLDLKSGFRTGTF